MTQSGRNIRSQNELWKQLLAVFIIVAIIYAIEFTCAKPYDEVQERFKLKYNPEQLEEPIK